MNIVKLFTKHGGMHVDSDELARGRTNLSIYTARGNKLSEVGKTQEVRTRASWGVHRDNLFASQALADAAYERVCEEILGRSAGDQA